MPAAFDIVMLDVQTVRLKTEIGDVDLSLAQVRAAFQFAEAMGRRVGSRQGLDINYMDIAEFTDVGFLQEANRLFFHPLGLALEVTEPGEGEHFESYISGVWDYRDDPEGMTFADDVLTTERAQRVIEERRKHAEARCKIFSTNTTVQPLPVDHPPAEDDSGAS